MLWGILSPDGAINVTTVAPQPGDVFKDGMAYDPDGLLRVVDADPDLFQSGLGMKEPGTVAVAIGGTIAGYQQGLPFTDTGRLVVQTGTPLPTDPFVGGIRVGEQGVYVIVSGGPPPSGPMPLYVASDGTAIITMFDTAQYPDVDLFDEVPREAIFNLLATPVDGYTLYPNTSALIADPGEAYIMSPASQVNLTNTIGAMLTGVDLATYINTGATVTIVYDPLLDAVTVTP